MCTEERSTRKEKDGEVMRTVGSVVVQASVKIELPLPGLSLSVHGWPAQQLGSRFAGTQACQHLHRLPDAFRVPLPPNRAVTRT